MNELLFNIVHKQKTESQQILKESTVIREVAAELKSSLKRKLVKAVIGPRRSGKSTLVHQVLSDLNENYAYYNFEDEQLPKEVSFEDINAVLGAVYPKASIYFFDEIQVFPKWEKLINRLERLGKRIIISGSNSRLLSSELASALTGRHEQIEVYPFSFSEYLKSTSGNDNDFHVFTNYLASGGFPDVSLNRVKPQNYLRELWDSIVLKDIVQRYKVRSTTELQALLSIFRDSVSNKFSLRSLERSLLNRASIATISKFISYGQGAYLTFPLQNFSFKARTRINADKKAYLIDNGFYSSMKAGSQEDYGKLLENFIFITLLRNGFKFNLDFFYYNTTSGKEVDFLTLSNGRPEALIQVCWSMNNQKTLEREITALTEAAEELGAKQLLIITAEEKALYERQGYKINVVPVLEYINW